MMIALFYSCTSFYYTGDEFCLGFATIVAWKSVVHIITEIEKAGAWEKGIKKLNGLKAVVLKEKRFTFMIKLLNARLTATRKSKRKTVTKIRT